MSGTPVYPSTIFPARYGGVYEGAPWICLGVHPEQVPEAATGDDLECSAFYEYYEGTIGRGETPQAAYDDLVRKVLGS